MRPVVVSLFDRTTSITFAGILYQVDWQQALGIGVGQFVQEERSMRTVIAIGAHHDDVELRAGGTLAKYCRAGWRVVYVVACTTPYYFPTPEQKATGRYLSNVEAIALRKAEAARAADILGVASADTHFFDYKSQYWYQDGTHELQYLDGVDHGSRDMVHYLEKQIPGRGYVLPAHCCPAEVEFVSGFIRRNGADLVLTHHPDDGHWEHYGICRLVFAALDRLRREGFAPAAFAWENGGAGSLTGSFLPTHCEDITATIDVKCEALRSFPSQFADHDTTPFITRARARARGYGQLAGMEFAEPFMPLQLDGQTDNWHTDNTPRIPLPPTWRDGMIRHGLMDDAAA
jgi:LmbE family N-acetylglucosaminyl deacetylase